MKGTERVENTEKEEKGLGRSKEEVKNEKDEEDEEDNWEKEN